MQDNYPLSDAQERVENLRREVKRVLMAVADKNVMKYFNRRFVTRLA